MSYAREEYLDSLKNKGDEASSNLHVLRQIQASAPSMKVLTNSIEWDKYISYLQTELEQVTQLHEKAVEKISSEHVWETEQLFKLKSSILVAKAIIDTLNFCMNLPKAIIEDSLGVNEMIKKFEEFNASKDAE